ncbi:exoribonuclease II [Salmonella enterica subsp. enterica serovar Heidelberg]|nr:exoribonuclease II [Salmonella enterica subsp. enterica serovar Heidelberg]
MFQDNPLLAQLKQQLHSQTPRAEGVVKATEKGFGFLEVDAQKKLFHSSAADEKSDAWRSYRRGHPHGKRT